MNLHLELEAQKKAAGNLLRKEIDQYLTTEQAKTYQTTLNKHRAIRNTP
ncbi:hypothetical protein [Psychromonas sp. CD1]|nr:hypothetical protein [Psychromonas sp. CD1]